LKEQRSSSLKAIRKHSLLVLWVRRTLNKRALHDLYKSVHSEIMKVKICWTGRWDGGGIYKTVWWRTVSKSVHLLRSRKRWQDDVKMYLTKISNDEKWI
jgi:hypothetical protein